MSIAPEPAPDVREGGSSPAWLRRHLRVVLGIIVLALVIVLAVLAVWHDRHQFAAALRDMGWATVLGGALAAVAGVGFTFPLWWNTLDGLGARLEIGPAFVAFFVSQLGKYLPGSVWPVVAQMEAGRTQGVNRRTMLAGNLFAVIINIIVGATLACVLLPLSSPDALRRFWWLFIALLALLPLLHPRVLPIALDKLFALARRPPMNERLRPRATVRAAGWGLLSWISLGIHVGILCAGLGHGSFTTFVTATGAMALAVCVGVLFIPAPAGAGLREVALLLALSPVLSDQQALAVVIVSRVTLIVVDLLLAAIALTYWRLSTSRP